MQHPNVHMFIVPLFAIAKTRKQPKCLSTDEWVKYIYIYSPWGQKESDTTEQLSLSHKYIYTPTHSRRLKDTCSLEGKL